VVRKLHPAAELAAYKMGFLKSAAGKDQEEKYLRLAAEFDNYKKRTSRQYAEIVKSANEELIQELLGVLDDFERALETASGTEPGMQGPNHDSLVKGMRLIYEKLLSVLKARGVSQFDAMDQPFDPQFHDAVMQLPSDKEEGTVIGVISPGYLLNEKVIRHAKVIVASSKQA
jgi:molecular chaperone GrpE